MTETRPTQADLDRAQERATRALSGFNHMAPYLSPEDERLVARCYLALAAENKALEERVRRYEVCWHCLDCLEQPELPAHCESCPQKYDCDVEGCEEPGCNTIVLSVREDGTPLLATVRTVDGAKAGDPPECEHPNRETRFGWCGDCGAGPELTESEEHDLAQMAAVNDDRASRRREYVRGAQAAVCEGERFYKDWLARLIFDETEPSE